MKSKYIVSLSVLGETRKEFLKILEKYENMTNKEKFRFDAINKLTLELTSYLNDKGIFRNCLNCEHWKEKEEICGMYKQRPPARIIVSGCPDHSDFIPF